MAGDASFASVSTLLHADTDPLTDVASTPKTYTAFGGAVIAATAKFGAGSMSFNGSTSYYSTPYHVNFDLGTGAFTIECFFRCTAISGSPCIFSRASSVSGVTRESALYFPDSTHIEFYTGVRGTSSAIKTFTVPTMSTATWYHLAVVRDGSSNWKLFLDGTASTTIVDGAGWSDSVNLDGGFPLQVGAFYAGAVYNPFNGFIDEFRITKGVARYSSNFTAPSVPFIGGLGQVAGTVRDGAGAPCARTVRVYRRDTGVLVASTTSDASLGTYVVDCPTLDEVHRIVLDDSGSPFYNDIIDRVTPA